MYRKVDHSLNFVDREARVLAFWKEKDIFKKQVAQHENDPAYTFYDGPPTANGRPHIGHVLTRAIKDLIPRYHSMKGENVLRKAGWDTHGLPVEIEVEKRLGISGKDQIEAYGIEPFIRECKKSVWTYLGEWEELSDRVGFWADMEHPYVTYHQDYIESEWWAVRQIWEKGLLYQGHKIVPYCPRCGTALASHEVAQGYKLVKENSIYVRFAVKDEPRTWFAVWTTTPWTLPSNVALTVHPEVDYVLIEREEEDGPNRYWVGASLIQAVFGEGEYKELRRVKGKELEHLHYEPLFPYALATIAQQKKDAYYVTCAEYVTTADGTGIVHCAPAFGEDDYKVGQAYDLPFVQLVDSKGSMTPEVEVAAGLFVKKADPLIIRAIQEKGRMIRVQPFEHEYPHCWRCDTPLIYYARDGWFIRMTRLREALMENNSHVTWQPPTIGSGRFGNFLENVIDWAVSRERYWGMPLPIWRCPDCGHLEVIGSIAELREKSYDCPEEIELHRPYIDQVHLHCPHCGGNMSRIPEVIDVWFDSGSMPFAQWHYPFENKELFEKRFPADFISEAVDQTRGWFYSLLAVSTLLFDKEAFKNCLVLGLVQDKNGVKMSKHKGNVIAPNEILDAEGADAVRWYFYSGSQPWLPSRFSAEAVDEVKRRFMGTIWNSYAFFIQYADLAGFVPGSGSGEQTVMDRFILSRLQTLISEVRADLDGLDITGAARSLEGFVDELSNWYVRLSRDRFSENAAAEDRQAALATLYEVLETLTRLLAPFLPFLAEEIYQNLVVGHAAGVPESVHLCSYPEADTARIDRELEDQMELAETLVSLGRTARAASGIKTRQPLQRLLVVSEQKLDPAYDALVAAELNIREIDWASDAVSLQDYRFKPELKRLGRRFGKRLGELRTLLSELDGREAYRQLRADGQITVQMADGPEVLSAEDLLVESVQAEGYASASEGGITVALDETLTPQLIEEGYLRELTSRIQLLRKSSGLEVSDHIRLYLAADGELRQILDKYAAEIRQTVLAEALLPLAEADAAASPEETLDINGLALRVRLQKLT